MSHLIDSSTRRPEPGGRPCPEPAQIPHAARSYRRTVARQPKDFKIAWVSYVEPLKPVVYVRTGRDTAIPTRFRSTVTLAEPEMAVTIEVFTGADLQPRIYEMTLRTNVQRPINSSRLRQVLVDQMMKAVMKEAEVPVDSLPPDAVKGIEYIPATGNAEEDASIAARIYRDAVNSGNPAPAQAVASAMGRSRAQVARYIRRARELGFLTERWYGLDDEGNET